VKIEIPKRRREAVGVLAGEGVAVREVKASPIARSGSGFTGEGQGENTTTNRAHAHGRVAVEEQLGGDRVGMEDPNLEPPAFGGGVDAQNGVGIGTSVPE